MGSFVLYILEWSLCLLIFLVVYKVCFSGSTFHRFNRFYLLGSVAIAALLPIIHINTDQHQEMDIEQLRIADTQFAHDLVSTTITHTLYHKNLSLHHDTPVNRDKASDQKKCGQTSPHPSLWAIVLILTYLTYIVLLIYGWAHSCYKMCYFLKGKRRYKIGRWIRIVVHDAQYGPFSWLNYVVISNEEDGFARKAGILHEISHVKKGHAIDLFFLLACTILNPVCWLVLREIKIVHEYEADDEVINRYHIHKHDYQRLLIMRTVGAEAYALASSFNLNIKERIKMMKKKQSTWWRMSCIFVTLPIVGIALTAFAEPRRVLIEKIDSEVNHITESVANNTTDRSTPLPDSKDNNQANNALTKPTTMTDTKMKAGDEVTGTVYGLNHFLVGANVLESDANQRIVNCATTDEKGQFRIKLKNPDNKLIVSYVGFNSFKSNFKQKNFQIIMEPFTVMHEITVVGYAKEEPVSTTAQQKTAGSASNTKIEIVEQMPAYPGGEKAWNEYILGHIHYPVAALENKVQANILVVFSIDKNGNVRMPKVTQITELNPLDEKVMLAAKEGDPTANDMVDAYNDGLESLKEEAVNILRHSSKWIPGRQNGNPVNCQYTVPIKFSLK